MSESLGVQKSAKKKKASLPNKAASEKVSGCSLTTTLKQVEKPEA